MPGPAVLLAQLAASSPQHRATTDAASSEYRYDVDDYYGNWARRLSYGGRSYGGDGGGYNQNNQQGGVQILDRYELVSAVSAFLNEEMEEPPDSWDVHPVTDFSTVFEDDATMNYDLSKWDVSRSTSEKTPRKL